MAGEIIINGLDMISTINLVNRRKRKYIAIILHDIEELSLDKDTYSIIRKTVLDNVNELTRAWLRDAYSGEVEGMDYHV